MLGPEIDYLSCRSIALAMVSSELCDCATEMCVCVCVLGLWRVALNHVCAHFKAYAQSSAQLQTQIGQPQLGKVNASVYIVCVCVNEFPSHCV